MSTELAGLRTGSAPRRSAVASVLVLPVADVLAMVLCFLLGGLVNFISGTVVVGFTAGAGLLIAASQLGNFFGLDLPRTDSLLQGVHALLLHTSETKAPVLAVSMVTLGVAVASRRWWRWQR